MQEQQINPLASKPLGKLLAAYALPSIIAMLVGSLYNIIDQIFIGQGIGYLGNAATNVSFPLTTIGVSLALLFGLGGALRFSLELGAGNRDVAAKTAGNAFVLLLAVGVGYMVFIFLFLTPLLTLFGATDSVMPYAKEYTAITTIGIPMLMVTNGMSSLARADGSPKYSMLCMLAGAVVNTILDPFFIFTLDMGIAGAAWATVLGQLVSFVMGIVYLKRFQHIQLRPEHFRLSCSYSMKIMASGMSNSINQMAITLVQIVLNNSLTYYGAQSIYGSDIPLACAGVAIKLYSLVISFIVGISQGSQPIIGFNYGAGHYARVRGVYRLAIMSTLAVSAAAFILFQVFPRQMMEIFGNGDALYMEFSIRFMRIFLFMVLFNGVQIISANFFAAIGKPMKGVFLSLTRQVIFLLPMVVLLPMVWGLDGILYAGPLADTAALATTSAMVLAQMRKIRQQERDGQVQQNA